MTITMARRVLWVSLLLLIPVPFYMVAWGWVPVARVVQGLIYRQLQLPVAGRATGEIIVSTSLMLQLLLWLLLLWGVAWAYGRLTSHWPDTVRGSVMGLGVFSLLIMFSSLPVYRPLSMPESGLLNFIQIYH